MQACSQLVSLMQSPGADHENSGEEGCLVLEAEWKENVYEGAETPVRDLNHGCWALMGFGG